MGIAAFRLAPPTGGFLLNHLNQSQHFRVICVQRKPVKIWGPPPPHHPLPLTFFYKAGRSPPQGLCNSVWMTEIGQSICELCERKKKSVSRWAGYIQTLTSTGLVVNHCAVAVASKGNSCIGWHVTRNIFLLPSILKLQADICSNGHQTNEPATRKDSAPQLRYKWRTLLRPLWINQCCTVE